MNEQERRKEIVQAEEAIRQLAIELARTTELGKQSEAARQSLVQATTALTQAHEVLRQAAENVSGVAGSAQDAVRRVEESTKLLADTQRRLSPLLWVIIILSACSLLVSVLRLVL